MPFCVYVTNVSVYLLVLDRTCTVGYQNLLTENRRLLQLETAQMRAVRLNHDSEVAVKPKQ